MPSLSLPEYSWGELYDVAFVDLNEGWAVGMSGMILHTTDGGDTWDYQVSGTWTDLLSVTFTDANHGWAVGYGGTILHYGGGLWTAPSETHLPARFALEQNYPNPFNPTTTIGYEVKTTGLVSVKVFDLLGRNVGTLVRGIQPAGQYSVSWNAENLPSGMYFCRMKAAGFAQTRKLMLLK
jgi:hypothetical protein